MCGLDSSFIAGIEIVDGAEPIQSHPFDGNTAFLLGNEGQVRWFREVTQHSYPQNLVHGALTALYQNPFVHILCWP